MHKTGGNNTIGDVKKRKLTQVWLVHWTVYTQLILWERQEKVAHKKVYDMM